MGGGQAGQDSHHQARAKGSACRVGQDLGGSSGGRVCRPGRILEEVRDKFPQLSRWVETCYGSPTLLNFGEEVITSEAGVQQGDPLGPLLFSLLLQPMAEQLHEVDGLIFNSWYLDDGTLVGTRAALQAA